MKQLQRRRAGVEREALRGAAEIRREWCDWHRRQAALFEDMAADHREKLGQRIDQGIK